VYPNQPPTSRPAPQLIRAFVLLAILLLIILGVVWAFNQSYVTITVLGGGSEKISYDLTNGTHTKTGSFKTGTNTKKIALGRGSYDVLVSQAGKSYFIVVKTTGLLRSVSVRASLVAERQRTFVGDDPSGCMFYTGQVLLSKTCNAPYNTLATHVPATADQPTYVATDTTGSLQGTVEGIVSTSEGTLALVQINDSEENPASQSIYRVDSVPNSPSNLVLLRPIYNLVSINTYKIKPFKQGFILYSDAVRSVAYYSSSQAEPSFIILPDPVSSDLAPQSFDATNDTLLSLLSNINNVTADNKSKKLTVELQIKSDTSSGRYIFHTDYASAVLCGTKKACLITNGRIDIYDISKPSAKLLYSVHNVQGMVSTPSGLYVQRGNTVLLLDADKATGYGAYTLGNLTLKSMQASGKTILLTVTDSRYHASALLIGNDADTSGGIDKQVGELDSLQSVKSLSAYGTTIFITPSVGALVYNADNRDYEYSPTILKSANDSINAKIKQLGINTSVYKIINTAQ
jgi:hypothetical protein